MLLYCKKNLMYFLILTLLVFIAYANSLNNAFISDDIFGIVNNRENLGNFQNVIRPFGFIQPSLYFIAYKIGGLNPFFFRIYNIFFHLGAVLTLFVILDQIGRNAFRPYSFLAFFTAAIFAVHPILTESVTWISGGTYVMYSFFFLLAFLSYILSKKDFRLYWVSVFMYYLSVNSGVPALILSVVFLIYELLFGEIKKNWLKILPYLAITVVVFIIYLKGVGPRLATQAVFYYQEQRGIYNPLVQIPIAITSYLQLIFWPDKLTLYHSEMSFTMVEYLIRVMGVIGVMGVIIWGWFKNRLIFFWLAFFIISLLPTLTPFGISWIVAERYVYLGSIGVISVVSYLLSVIIKNKKTEAIGYLIFIIIIISFIIRTIIRNNDWKNEDNLWIATGKTSPSYHVTHNNLGDVYGRRGDFNRAIEEFKLAIKINPHYADAYHNLGNTYRQIGKINEAMESYKKAFQLNPYLWQSAMNIAAIYFEEGKYQEAADYMLFAIKVNPKNSSLYSNLGIIYLKMGDKKKAEEVFITALRLNPNNQQAKIGLSSL